MTIVWMVAVFLIGFFVIIAVHSRREVLYWRRKAKKQETLILQMQQLATLTDEQRRLIEELNSGT